MKEWARNDPPSAIAALFAVIVALEWLLLGGKTGAALAAFDGITDDEKKVEAFGKLISAIGLLAAAPVGVAGVALAFWRSWNQHRDGLTAIRKLDAETYAKAAEAFAKAVEQLGHDKSSIRMGAVLALEALGKSTPRLLSQTIEILCADLREPPPVSKTASTGETAETGPILSLPTDKQLILDIVRRLKQEDKDNRIQIDLSRADLRNADMSGANLSKIVLSEANLSGVNLNNAVMNGANLSGTNLSGASMSGTDLSGASLNGANLSGASLCGTNLSGAGMSGTDLSGTSMFDAKLRGAILIEADLSGASLMRADLGGAYLIGAKLTGTNLVKTIFHRTTLPDRRVWTGEGPPPAPDPTPVTNA